MSVLMVQARIKEDHVEDVENAVRKMFGAIETAEPGNVRYASCKGSDGATFVVLLEVADGSDNPLLALPEFRDFQSGLPGWVDGPPATDQLTVIGSFRLFN